MQGGREKGHSAIESKGLDNVIALSQTIRERANAVLEESQTTLDQGETALEHSQKAIDRAKEVLNRPTGR